MYETGWKANRNYVEHRKRSDDEHVGWAPLPPGAVRETKRLMRRARNAAVLETIGVEGGVFAQRLQSPEAKEAFSAFFQKRKPDFSKF